MLVVNGYNVCHPIYIRQTWYSLMKLLHDPKKYRQPKNNANIMNIYITKGYNKKKSPFCTRI